MNIFEKIDELEELEEVKEENTESISIFKLSDKELYGDDKQTKEEKKKTPMKKSQRNMIIMIIVTVIAIIAAVVTLIWGLNQHKLYQDEAAKVELLTAKNQTCETEINNLKSQVADLQAQIKAAEEAGAKKTDSDYVKGVTIKITEEGHTQVVRKKASEEKGDNLVLNNDGTSCALYWGETVTLIEDAIVDANGTLWGKIDKGFIRLVVDGEKWATIQ